MLQQKVRLSIYLPIGCLTNSLPNQVFLFPTPKVFIHSKAASTSSQLCKLCLAEP